MKIRLYFILIVLNIFNNYSQHKVYQVHNVNEDRWCLTDTSFLNIMSVINKSSDSTIFLIRLAILDSLMTSEVNYNIDYECFKVKTHLIGDLLLERPFVNTDLRVHFNIPDGFWLRLMKSKDGIDTLTTFYVIDSLLELKFVENDLRKDGTKFKEIISFQNGKLDGFNIYFINDTIKGIVLYKENIAGHSINFHNKYTNEQTLLGYKNFMPESGKGSETYNFGTILRFIDLDNNFEIIGDKYGFFTIEKW
jgi:hypothetical protein